MSLYRRSGTGFWWCRFTLGGREVRCSTGAADRAQAEEFEHELRKRHWREVRLGQAFHSFGDAAERWLRERATKRSIERDRQILAEYADLSKVGLADFSRDMLEQLRQAREQAVAVATVNREMALIRAILNAASGEWGWLEAVPKVPMRKIEQADPRWLTREQFRKLVALLPPHAAAMARLAVATGLRRANITGLTWDRVDLAAKAAYIPSSQAKGKRGIAVPLNGDAIAVIKSRIGTHDTHVFSWRGEPVEQLMTKAWRRAAAAAGVPGLKFHDLRHTWASWQAQSGTPLYALRELGGWASEAMVRRYAHLSPGHLAEFADRTLLDQPRGRRPKVGTGRSRKARKHA